MRGCFVSNGYLQCEWACCSESFSGKDLQVVFVGYSRRMARKLYSDISPKILELKDTSYTGGLGDLFARIITEMKGTTMNQRNRWARINIKVLGILFVTVLLLGASLLLARQVRRRVLSARDLAAGRAAYAEKDWKTAFSHYAEYLGRNVDDVEILKAYAHASVSIRPLEISNLLRAVGSYRRVIQLDPSDGVAYEKLARIYTYMRDFDELAYIAGKRLDAAPTDRKATLWLTDAYAGQDKIGEARQLLLPYLRRLEKETDRYEEYVLGCIKMSQFPTSGDRSDAPSLSQGWLNRAVAYDPNSAEARLLLARFHRESSAGRASAESRGYTQARSNLEAIAALDFVPPMIHLATGLEWMALGDLEKTTAILKEAEEYSQEVLGEHILDPTEWLMAKYQLASELALRQKDLDEVARLTDGILGDLEKKRYRSVVLPHAVNSYVSAGVIDQAREALDEYAELVLLQKGNVSAKKNLTFLQALVAEAEGNPGLVIDTLQPEVGHNATPPHYWQLLAHAYGRTGKTQPAIHALENFLSYFPRDITMTAQLARAHFTLRDWEKATTMAKRAESLDPNNVALWILRTEAEIYYSADQTLDARNETLRRLSDELKQRVQAQPERPDMRMLQALIARQQKRYDQEEQILLRAVEECPHSLPAEMQLASLYVRTQRLDEAIQTCQRACERNARAVQPWLVLAKCHEANQDTEAALNVIKQADAQVLGPEQRRTLSLKQALLELAAGERGVGIALLKALAMQNAQDMQVRARLLETSEIREDPDFAARLIQELRSIEGGSGVLWRYHQAVLWLSQDDWRAHQQDIVDHLQRCIDTDTRWALPRLALISLYQRTRDFDQIEDLCRSVLAKNPQARDAAEQLVMLLEQQGRFAEAESFIQQLDQNDDISRIWDIRTSLREGNLSPAIEEIKRKAAGNEQDIESRILLARLTYRQTEDANQALAHLAEATLIDPCSTAVVAARTAILNGEGRTEDVQQLLNDHVKEVGSFDAYLLRGAYTVELGRAEDAESDYQKLLTFADTGPGPHVLVADYYLTTGNLDKGIRTLQTGRTAFPEDPVLRRRIMLSLFQRGTDQDHQQAEVLLSALEEEYPDNTEFLNIRALQKLQQGTAEGVNEAQTILERIVELDPTAVDTHLTLITVDMQKQDYEAARARVIQALGANPKHPALLSVRARLELELKNTTMATELMGMALQENPKRTQTLGTLLHVANQTQNQGLLKDIQALLDTRIQQEPASESLRRLKTRTLVARGLTEQAVAELESYTESETGREALALVLELANLYLNQDMVEQAEQKIQQAATLTPNSPALLQTRMNLATRLSRTGQNERAAAIFEELLETAPNNGLLLNNYAWLLQGKFQRYDEALALASRGLALYPDNLNILDTRGTILARMEGRLADAKADFNRLVEVSPPNSPNQAKALVQLGRVCVQLNEINQAIRHLTQAQSIDRTTPVFTDEERQKIAKLLTRK